jgi:glycine/D-amino acid oxidase-like deaminating enzyme
MGSSTALHLARRGYSDIRIIDQFQPPSANSAGNDMNKVSSWNDGLLMSKDVVDSVRFGHMGQACIRNLGCLE